MRLETPQDSDVPQGSDSGSSVSALMVARLLRLADQATEPTTAMACYSQAVRLDATTRSHYALGLFLLRDGQADQAIRVAEEARQKSLASEDWLRVASATHLLVEAYRQTGQIELAERSLQLAARAEMATWTAGQADFSFDQLLLSARMAGDQRDWSRSVVLSQAALSRATLSQQPVGLCQLATALFWSGDLAGAARQGLRAIQLVKSGHQRELMVDVLLELTPHLEAVGRVPMALKAYQLASRAISGQKLKSTHQQTQVLAAQMRCRRRIRMTCIPPEWN